MAIFLWRGGGGLYFHGGGGGGAIMGKTRIL